MAITAKQRAFLDLLISRVEGNEIPPSIRELQELGGFASSRSVTQYLDSLETEGYIVRDREARSIRIVHGKVPRRIHATTTQVPLIGRIAAGTPILATQNIEDYYPVASTLVRGGKPHFLLEVSGDSMDRADINDGDLVLVRHQVSAENGQHVVALIDDSATVKRLRRTNGLVILEPVSSNPKNKPIILDRDFLIQGIVISTIPKNRTRE